MKPDKQHIDDFFRDSLSDFAPQPAKSSWKRISARLLWDEISHLRFGNIPKFWIGITAGSVILFSVLFTSILSEEPSSSSNLTETQPESVNEAQDNQSHSGQDFDPLVAPSLEETQQSSFAEEKNPIVESQGIAERSTLIDESPESGGFSETTGSIPSSSQPSTTEKEIDINSENQNQSISQVMPGKPSLSQTDTEIPPEATNVVSNIIETGLPSWNGAETQVSKNAVVETVVSETENIQVEIPDSKTLSPATTTSILDEASVAPSALSNTEEMLSNVTEQPLQQIGNTTISGEIDNYSRESDNTFYSTRSGEFSQPRLISVIPGVVENRYVAGDENSISSKSYVSNQLSQASAGKIQKHNTRNSILYSIFRGEYKPPKRSFQDPITAMYGGAKPYFTVSAYFSPEVTEYQRIASASRERSYYGGLALTYNTSRIVIQSGVEYSSFRDLGDYMVNMSTYDSVGFYHHVTGFEIDPNNPDSVIFHTQIVAVWDSVQHHSHQQTRNNYTYLQLPLMIGYKAMDRGLFSAHIKAGPSFSLLLNRKEPTLDFAMPGATITGIDNYTAPRLKANVQLLVSLAMHFQFTEKFGLLVEPTYRYYVNPVYDINSETLNKPFGISVKTGVFYNF